MRAIVLEEVGGPDKLVVKEVDNPQPKEGQVLVKLKTAALNRRDVWITLGAYPKINLPAICGSDGAGVIEKCGAGVDDKLVGQESIIYPALNWGENPRCGGADFRVLGMPEQGTFAEYICVPRSSIFAKPIHLSWEEAAALPLAGLTSWRATFSHGELKKNERILITGIGGGCATFVLQWAKATGAMPYVTSSNENKLEQALKLGAITGFNYKKEGWEKEAKRVSGGFDLIVDSGGGDGLNSLLDTLNPGGRYVFFGATQGDATKGLSMAKLFFKQIRIQGSTMGSESEFAEMIHFVEKHNITPTVDKVYPLEHGVEAHHRMLNSEQTGKIVIKF